MAYRIEYALQDGGVLCAKVRGKSSLSRAAGIGRDIAEQASRHAASRLLLDLTGLLDRVGTLKPMFAALVPRRVAVLDGRDYEDYYAWHRQPRFSRPAEAISWLAAGDLQASAADDGKTPRPPGTGGPRDPAIVPRIT